MKMSIFFFPNSRITVKLSTNLTTDIRVEYVVYTLTYNKIKTFNEIGNNIYISLDFSSVLTYIHVRILKKNSIMSHIHISINHSTASQSLINKKIKYVSQ